MMRDVLPPPIGQQQGAPRARVPPPVRERRGQYVARMFASAASWLGFVSILGTVLIAIVHVNDRSEVDQNPGAWLVQSQSVRNGDLVAPLSDGGRLAGTRYQPPLTVVLAGVERLVGGHPVLAWKLLALAAFLALFTLIAALAKRLGASTGLIVATLGALAAFGPLHQVAVRSGADATAFAIGLLATATVAWGRGRFVIQIAGLVAALAVLVKLTVVWPLIVGALWLFRRRRQLVAFLTSAAATLILGVVAFQVGSSGRWYDNMRVGLGSGGDDGVHGLDSAVSRFVHAVSVQGALGAVVLLAAVVVAWTALQHRTTIWQLSFGLAVLTAVPLYSDVGVVSNHLLDTVVLAVLVVIEATCGALSERGEGRLIVGAILLVVGLTQISMLIAPLGRASALLAGAERRSSEQLDPFGALIPKGARLLSEDPTFAVLRGERPVIGDPFMARRLFRRHPAWLTSFERRIAAHEFDRVILAARGTKPPWWYSQVHLGERFVAAVRASYEPIGRVGVYEVYGPRPPRA